MQHRTHVDVKNYSRFGCPKCGAKHKYGHDRDNVTCYRCWYDFWPQHQARLYEEDRISVDPLIELEYNTITLKQTTSTKMKINFKTLLKFVEKLKQRKS